MDGIYFGFTGKMKGLLMLIQNDPLGTGGNGTTLRSDAVKFSQLHAKQAELLSKMLRLVGTSSSPRLRPINYVRRRVRG